MFPIRDINPTRITPVLTVTIIVVNVLVFFAWQPRDDPQAEVEFLYERAAVACEITTAEPLTVDEIRGGRCTEGDAALAAFPDKNVFLAIGVSMFLHGGLFHILGNMWFLWIFGNNVEEAFGFVGYLLLYLAGGVVATLGFVFLNSDTTVPLVGASGAIAAVLGAYLVLFPTHQILSLVFFFFVPVPAVLFLGLWFLGQFGVDQVGVAWEAHAVGFVFGVVIAALLRTPLLNRLRQLHATRPFA